MSGDTQSSGPGLTIFRDRESLEAELAMEREEPGGSVED
jgi:hypothetical protein